MNNPIVDANEPITLVGGGQASVSDLQEALELAPTCVAVDSGAALALQGGVMPDAVLGDMDSIADTTLADIPAAQVHRISEQESTDFEKALRHVAAPLVLGVGFLGGRLDHQLAALHGLLAFAHRPCVLLGSSEIVFLAPPSVRIATTPGDVVSLFPLVEGSGHSTGLEWPIAGLTLRPGGRIGTSNRAVGPVRLQFGAPGTLVILPRRLIRAVVADLSRPDAARWPAPPE